MRVYSLSLALSLSLSLSHTHTHALSLSFSLSLSLLHTHTHRWKTPRRPGSSYSTGARGPSSRTPSHAASLQPSRSFLIYHTVLLAFQKDIRSPPVLDHIPLSSPLYGGVYREGAWCLSLSLPPLDGSQLSRPFSISSPRIQGYLAHKKHPTP